MACLVRGSNKQDLGGSLVPRDRYRIPLQGIGDPLACDFQRFSVGIRGLNTPERRKQRIIYFKQSDLIGL